MGCSSLPSLPEARTRAAAAPPSAREADVMLRGGSTVHVRAIRPDDETPLGDTDEHAGEQTEDGRTVGGQDADVHGGTGAPPRRMAGGGQLDSPDVARPVVGGEAEGERSAR